MVLNQTTLAEVIQGQADGAGFIRDLQERYCDPDALYGRVLGLVNAPANLRGFCREIQKHIEWGA